MRRARDRFGTDRPGVRSRHGFSFGAHYDPEQVGHGRLVVCDEHRLRPGAGFPLHPHRDLEVVSWVLDGVLVHEGAGTTRLRPGSVQRMSAGLGVRHAERADRAGARFVQAWLLPAVTGLPPSYEHRRVPPERLRDALVPVVSGLGHAGAVRLGAPAALHVGRLAPGRTVALPRATRLHLLVVRGALRLGRLRLGEMDAARLTGAAPAVTAQTAAELLVWELPERGRQE